MPAWGRNDAGESNLRGFACPDEVWVGSCVSEVSAAFRANQAGMWQNHDDRALRPDLLLRREQLSFVPSAPVSVGFSPSFVRSEVCF